MDEIKTYESIGINWVWYLDVIHNPNMTVTIVNHYRMHKYEGDKHPDAVGTYELTETDDSKRIVISARLGGVIYKVANPKYVFDYGK